MKGFTLEFNEPNQALDCIWAPGKVGDEIAVG